jgi:flagellar basal-body rod protein FlgC
MNAMEISLTGLDVEWRRLEVIAQNLANAGSTVDALGEAYRPMRLISGPKASFAKALDGGIGFDGVKVYDVAPQNISPRRVYEPGHPQADAQGFVSYSGLDHPSEMALLVKTSRAYEANIVSFNAARQMYAKALEIGKRGA